MDALTVDGEALRQQHDQALDILDSNTLGTVVSQHSQPHHQNHQLAPSSVRNCWGNFGYHCKTIRPPAAGIELPLSQNCDDRSDASLGPEGPLLGPSIIAHQHTDKPMQSQPQSQGDIGASQTLMTDEDEDADLPDLPEDGNDPELWDDEFLSELLTQMTSSQPVSTAFNESLPPRGLSQGSFGSVDPSVTRVPPIKSTPRNIPAQPNRASLAAAAQPVLFSGPTSTNQPFDGKPASANPGAFCVSPSSIIDRSRYPPAALSPRTQLAERAESVRRNALEAPLDGFAEARVTDGCCLTRVEKRKAAESAAGESCKKCAKLEITLGKMAKTVNSIEKQILALGKVCSRADRKQAAIEKTCSQALGMWPHPLQYLD